MPLTQPGRWTPIFFLDDAVALAAGHRPCGYCRRDAYRSYRDAVTEAIGSSTPLRAGDLNRRLTAERYDDRKRGRGMGRADDRRRWSANLDDLPVGTVIVDESNARLVLADRLLSFSFGGWTTPAARPSDALVSVLTPPTSVEALRDRKSVV